jgi:hypothetical protein
MNASMFRPRARRIDVDTVTATHTNKWQQLEPRLFSIKTVPRLPLTSGRCSCKRPTAIFSGTASPTSTRNQNAHTALGGISAIAISHPHYYTTMQEWAAAFDAPVYLHASDREWVMRDSPAIHFWEGMRWRFSVGYAAASGGHFAGGTVLHWQEGEGFCWWAIFCRSRRERRRLVYVELPEYASAAGPHRGVGGDHLEGKMFERLYGAFEGQNIRRVRTSAAVGPEIYCLSEVKHGG